MFVFISGLKTNVVMDKALVPDSMLLSLLQRLTSESDAGEVRQPIALKSYTRTGVQFTQYCRIQKIKSDAGEVRRGNSAYLEAAGQVPPSRTSRPFT
ncbi:hypothetical protein J6590_051877 [Homalodisca vitripennis]|nr:hypothetical protein J6590_051877 [Homalodisca vitripennis]